MVILLAAVTFWIGCAGVRQSDSEQSDGLNGEADNSGITINDTGTAWKYELIFVAPGQALSQGVVVHCDSFWVEQLGRGKSAYYCFDHSGNLLLIYNVTRGFRVFENNLAVSGQNTSGMMRRSEIK